MKYISSFMAAFLLLFSSLLVGQSISMDGEDFVFQDKMEVYMKPTSIEFQVTLITEGTNSEETSIEHQNRLDQINQLISSLGKGAIFYNPSELDLNRRPGILSIRSSERVGRSTFNISLKTDTQIYQVLNNFFTTDGIIIDSYNITYGEEISDENINTELTNKIIVSIAQEAKKLGNKMLPRNIGKMNISRNETGRDKMDQLIAGEVLENWDQSDNQITLVQKSKYAVISVIAR